MDSFDEILFSQGQKEFFYVHGIHRVTVYPSDRKGKFLPVHSNAEQTSGGNHVIFRGFLTEILQRSNCSLTKLDLIKDNECIASGNGLTTDMG